MEEIDYKRLISEVLNITVTDVQVLNDSEGNLDVIADEFSQPRRMNISKLSFDCLDYMNKQGYQTRFSIYEDGYGIELGLHGRGYEKHNKVIQKKFSPSAIFELCELVMEIVTVPRKKEVCENCIKFDDCKLLDSLDNVIKDLAYDYLTYFFIDKFKCIDYKGKR